MFAIWNRYCRICTFPKLCKIQLHHQTHCLVVIFRLDLLLNTYMNVTWGRVQKWLSQARMAHKGNLAASSFWTKSTFSLEREKYSQWTQLFLISGLGHQKTSLASAQLAAYNCRTGVIEDCRIQTRRVCTVMWALEISFETLPRHKTLLCFAFQRSKPRDLSGTRCNAGRVGRRLDNLMPD